MGGPRTSIPNLGVSTDSHGRANYLKMAGALETAAHCRL